jgi:multiple sugar transport system ATP-binding protein
VGGIRLESVTKVYPNGVRAVDGIDLEIDDGEFMVLVGPSGCGKSTLLRTLAGLEEVTEGRIFIGDRNVTDMSPPERDIAMVFQNYALYPHKNVKENLAFALRMKKVPKQERERRVAEVARTLGLDELLDRKPAALSGGQRQRVAMGRAIVREPKAFLMDEPLSNLDAKLRVSMRAELARLHERLGVTTVYVTHDQVESMTLGERVAVLRDGVLQQCDRPQSLYDRPANLFVAAFMGSPSMNLVEATISDGHVSFAGFALPLAGHADPPARSDRVILGIRPDDLVLAAHAPGWPTITARVEIVEELGGESLIVFPIEAPLVTADAVMAARDTPHEEERLLMDDRRATFTARISGRDRPTQSDQVELAVDVRHLHFFDPTTGDALTGGHA